MSARAEALRAVLDSIGDRKKAEHWMAAYLLLGGRAECIVPYGSPDDPFAPKPKAEGSPKTPGAPSLP